VSKCIELFPNQAGPKVSISTVGGRIVQISDPHGFSWLVETSRPEPERNPNGGFRDGTQGGWDDCIPSIDSEEDPNPERDGKISDHGDFWSVRWDVADFSDATVTLAGSRQGQPLMLRKSVSVNHKSVFVTLRVTNSGLRPYRFLYSGHPLLRWTADARVQIDDAEPIDLARSGTPRNYKWFVSWKGRVELRLEGTPHSLVLSQSTLETPWLGLCVNRDFWPTPGIGHSWIALEPTTSPTDSLIEAIRSDSARELGAGEECEFTTRISFEERALNSYS